MQLRKIFIEKIPKTEQKHIYKNCLNIDLESCPELVANQEQINCRELSANQEQINCPKCAINPELSQTEKSALIRQMKSCAKESIFLSENQEALDKAAEMGLATIGYQKSGSETFLQADMVVEGFEEVDFDFMQKVWQRHHQIPWTILETERLVIRELELADLDDLFELYAYPGMTEHMEGLYPYEEEKEYQKAYIENMYHFYGYGMWLVYEKDTNKLVGRAGLEHRSELDGELELGYAIGTPFQKQGYATEACKAIISYAKEYLGFGEIVCLIEPENEVSKHLATKLGFTFQKLQNIDGTEMEKYHFKFE